MSSDLEHFVTAQDSGGTYATALSELRRGRKTSHWMWFVFPQISGLGFSAMAQRYAIADLAQARAYLAHPVLGPRLVEAAQAALHAPARDVGALLGGIDAVKLRSSMTLFEAAAADQPNPADQPGQPVLDGSVFAQVLDRHYGGERDEETLRRL